MNIGNITSTDDDTITINNISRHQPLNDIFTDETLTQGSPAESKPNDYTSRRKVMSPVSPPPAGSVSSSTNMWDELENIKRRLRQLELYHSPTGERPQTRGTTNSSSSPQRSSPFPSQAGTSVSTASSPSAYPLLNAAITKVKASGISTDVAQAIEATVQDVISLALVTNNPDHSNIPPSPRVIRKRVDGICRGLTEVCLALADHQQASARQATRVAQHKAEDAQDSSPLSATHRQAMTLTRTSARRLSSGTATSRTVNTVSRARRTAVPHSVVGIPGDDYDDDGVSVVSRPGLTRFSTIQYRPPSRASTEVFRETAPPVPTTQRFSTNRRSLLSRHTPSMSDYNVPADRDPSSDDSSFPRGTRSTVADSPENRRRSLNLASYFSSPPRARTEFTRESGLPAPTSTRPVSLISPPRVNVATNGSAERRDTTMKRRAAGSLAGEPTWEPDIDDVRSSTLTRSLSNRQSIGAATEIRRHASITRRYGSGRED